MFRYFIGGYMMKKLIVLLLALFLTACSNNTGEK